MWVGASSTALVFMVLAWVLPNVLGLEGSRLWILRGALGFLGLVAALLVGRFISIRSRKKGPARKKDPEEEKLDLLFKEARSRLASSAAVATSRLDRLPMMVVLGPRGSTKTTVVTRSGLDPELLAGEVHRGETVVPTEGVNLWYGDGIVVAEAGSDLLDDGDRWSRLMGRLRPARLRAALSRQPQAPRVAVVCVSCEDLLAPGAARSLADRARSLRARLGDAARELGIQLPVYVLLTKADRIPHFEEFAANLSHEEAAEVLGVTLPLRSFTSSGSYGSEQSRRLSDALEELNRSLARKRLDVLPRENAEVARQAAYEFPREVRKLSDPLQDFLLELCRPGHLGASPLLRGFYFTGVRPVLVTESAGAERPPAAEPAPEPSTAGATSVFSAAELREAAKRSAAEERATTRKVPQWVFLEGIFQKVVLADRNAMGVTGSGTRVNVVRRLALGAVAFAAFVTLLGMTTSFFTNRGLQQDVAVGLRGVEAPPALGAVAGVAGGEVGEEGEADEDSEAGEGGDPTGDDMAAAPATADVPLHYLEQLDALGEELDRLREWEEGRPPFRYRWGLYRGGDLLSEVRQAYFLRFREILWDDTRERLVAFLESLPPEPAEDSDYEETYNALKAYLMTTEHPEESTAGFLAPVLMAHRGIAGGEGDAASELALRQFRRFASELRLAGNPYPEGASEARIASARRFLGEFAAVDQFYQALVSRVSSELGTFEFQEAYPFASTTLRTGLAVPGAFTREGWEAVQEILADPDALLVSEEWVVGEQVVSPEDRVALARSLEDRYRADYIDTWQSFLRSGSVPSFGSVAQAADGLHTLSGNDSPIVYLISETSRNTAVDSDEVRAVFQPVHALVPPEDPDAEEEPAGDAVLDYLDNLVNLQASLDQLDGASGPLLQQVLLQAERDASQARASISQLARDFERDGGARLVGDDLERIMEEPIAHTTRLLGGYEQTQAAGGINEQGGDFCSRFDEVGRLFPFNASAQAEASIDDVKALFQPGESRLSTFHDEVLADLVTLQGGRWEARSGASPAPTSSFLSFYNQAHQVSEALFNDQGEGPRARFFLRMEATAQIPEIEVEVDGQSQTYTRTSAPTRDFVWDGEQAQTVRISGEVDGARRTLLEAEGPWAVFRLFQRTSAWQDTGGGAHRVSWRIPDVGVEINADVNFAGAGLPVFRSDFLATPACVSQVVR